MTELSTTPPQLFPQQSKEGCLSCGRGLCLECRSCKCCNPETSGDGQQFHASKERIDVRPSTSIASDDSQRAERGRPIKNPGEIQDRHSTGRKRAAVLYPIMSDNEPCEWQRTVNAGGGKFPIIGCIRGVQQHRHHGPDKNTLNNAPGNVHRICDDCHNIWHSQNDPVYDESDRVTIHQPRKASNRELLDRQLKVRYYVGISEG